MTKAENERLTLLIEECSEVIKSATKCQRFGYASQHPFDSNWMDNRHQLRGEIWDVLTVLELMDEEGDINLEPEDDEFAEAKAGKKKNILVFTKFQK